MSTRSKVVIAVAVSLPALAMVVVLVVLPVVTMVLMWGAQAQSAAAAADPCAGQMAAGGAATASPGSAVAVAYTPPGMSSASAPTVSASGAPAPARVEGLNEAQTRIAMSIVAVGEQRKVPVGGIVVALSVARQESSFRNLANDGSDPRLKPDQKGVGASLRYPHDGVGHDHGSVNAFQQQWPWWGTMDELMNPPTAAAKFYDALMKVPGWQQLPVTVAAQRVQQSAYPSAYADDEQAARRIYAALKGSPLPADAQVLCGDAVGGTAMGCPPTRLPVEKGMTPDALRVVRCVHKQYPSMTLLGIGSRPAGTGDDHATGRAVDVMVDGYTTAGGRAQGDQVAAWARANAKALGIKYVIWDVKIWNVERDAEGWRPYRYPGAAAITDTTLHKDHVHISVYGNQAVSTPPAGGAVKPGSWAAPMAPGSYRLTSPYGMGVHPVTGVYKLHTGQDMAGPVGTPLIAAANARVKSSSFNTAYGNLTILDAGGGVEIYYAHQSATAVKAGQTVTAGQVIGARGNTGYSTGPHLHFEIRVNGTPVDPMPYMRSRGVDLTAGASH